jgi:beta-xylosidase
MIKIENKILKTQENFWNHCLFHPTDAVEDPWGRRILDRIARDKAITGVRIYAMLEDIVYIDEDGEIAYDFRISDLRLDYLIDRGFDLLLAYAGIPDCIATSTQNKTSVSKNKTRYKGKMWNSAPPKDFAVWEEICYEYTKHLVERYGIEKVCTFRMQCFNEADIPHFSLS